MVQGIYKGTWFLELLAFSLFEWRQILLSPLKSVVGSIILGFEQVWNVFCCTRLGTALWNCSGRASDEQQFLVAIPHPIPMCCKQGGFLLLP